MQDAKGRAPRISHLSRWIEIPSSSFFLTPVHTLLYLDLAYSHTAGAMTQSKAKANCTKGSETSSLLLFFPISPRGKEAIQEPKRILLTKQLLTYTVPRKIPTSNSNDKVLGSSVLRCCDSKGPITMLSLKRGKQGLVSAEQVSSTLDTKALTWLRSETPATTKNKNSHYQTSKHLKGEHLLKVQAKQFLTCWVKKEEPKCSLLAIYSTGNDPNAHQQ